MLKPLDEILTYRHPGAIRAFQRNFPQLADDAERLFTDMLKFLWLSRKHEFDMKREPDAPHLQFIFVMHVEMLDIDNMWHAFILYTREYAEFCQQYFGTFMHHEPDVGDAQPLSPEDFAVDLEKFLSYIYDNLGEDTVRRWFRAHVTEAVPVAA